MTSDIYPLVHCLCDNIVCLYMYSRIHVQVTIDAVSAMPPIQSGSRLISVCLYASIVPVVTGNWASSIPAFARLNWMP